MTDGSAEPRIPAYLDLPRHPTLNLPHSWDHFGREDNLGTLNQLTPARVVAATAAVRSGERFALSLPTDAIDPPLFGRRPLTREVFATSRNDWDERLDDVFPQAGSQWDGFLHVRAREAGFYTGFTGDPPEAAGRLGIEHWSAGIVGRGVLLDLATYLTARGNYDPLQPQAVHAQELSACAAEQSVAIEPGDIACLRFGWTAAYRRLDPAGRAELAGPTGVRFAGLAGSEAVAAWLWDRQIAALACDNPAAEVAPGDPAVGSLHRRLLPMLGMPIAELLDFEALSSACRAQGRWTFLFVGVPHTVPGSVASPANAIAVR